MKIGFTLNGAPVCVEAPGTVSLLTLLRDYCRLTGTKRGCDIGECGACTVLVGEQTCASCLTMVGQVEGQPILTVEGLQELPLGRLLQESFMDHGAVQCGFCTPGMLISAYALLLHNPSPTRDEIRTAMSGNLCRCTGYVPIVQSVEYAAKAAEQA